MNGHTTLTVVLWSTGSTRGNSRVPRRGLAILPGEPGKPVLACVSAPREEG